MVTEFPDDENRVVPRRLSAKGVSLVKVKEGKVRHRRPGLGNSRENLPGGEACWLSNR
jgi:hypothetical protein